AGNAADGSTALRGRDPANRPVRADSRIHAAVRVFSATGSAGPTVRCEPAVRSRDSGRRKACRASEAVADRLHAPGMRFDKFLLGRLAFRLWSAIAASGRVAALPIIHEDWDSVSLLHSFFNINLRKLNAVYASI